MHKSDIIIIGVVAVILLSIFVSLNEDMETNAKNYIKQSQIAVKQLSNE